MDSKELPISRNKIIAGIDLGSTYSGLAWAETRRPDRLETVTTWPASNPARDAEFEAKVPTRLEYVGEEVLWGFGAPVTTLPGDVMDWFKLDLDPSLQSMIRAFAKGSGDHDVGTLMTDYLSALIRHLTSTLRQRLGAQVLSSTPLEYVITVPALWSDDAKARTLQACRDASGSSAVDLISESEAAAISALRELGPQSRGLGVGDTVMVVDAGGATADVISYVIGGLDGPTPEVTEPGPAAGALCGSGFLDLRFTRYMRARLGGEKGFDDEVLAGAVEHFEKKIKRQFTIHAPPATTYPVPVPDLADNDDLSVSDGHYALQFLDLVAIFEPVILETTKLATEYISSLPRPPKAVLLVGGFGESDYLRERLQIALGDVEVMRPTNSWQAVVQGAVMKGLATAEGSGSREVEAGVGGRDQDRVERRHYGTVWRVRYDGAAHASLRGERYWCGLDGCYKVPVMKWFPKRTTPAGAPLETIFLWTGPVSKGRVRTIKIDIYTRAAEGPGPLSRDPSVELLCRVEADLSGVPESQLRRRKGLDGRWYYYLQCEIEGADNISGETIYTLKYNGG
ncbi:related to hsp70 protein [Cephalotrichum gorgonifer]|uniref:Related to hsp70 protein n=1 Tax=Cephalotrichum gorgonifer TaxID=2041049 RepID=A0AAE8SW86_9PEZI|nr:related to hsp70 protein [Cephalotrichum gorgonifer]